jgi:hypothetical protein
MSISHRIIEEEGEEEQRLQPPLLDIIIPENDEDDGGDDGDDEIIIIEPSSLQQRYHRSILSGGSLSVGEEELRMPDKNDDVIIGIRTLQLQLSSGFDCGNNFSSSSSETIDDGLSSITATTKRNKNNNGTSAISTTNKRHTILLLVGLMATVMTMTTMMSVLLSSSSSSASSVPLPIKNYLPLKKQQTISTISTLLLTKDNFNSVGDQNKKNDPFLSSSLGEYQHRFRKRHRRFLQEEKNDDFLPEITIVVPPGVNSTNTSALNEITATNTTNGSNITINNTAFTVNSTIFNGNDNNGTINFIAVADILPTSAPTILQPNITVDQFDNNTLTPTIILNTTDPPTSPPSMPPTNSFQPTISSEPTDLPSISFQPTGIPTNPPTFRPTLSPAPSISYAPSSVPSNLPTTKPPSVHPSESPSKSAMPTNTPSDAPTEFPTISPLPSSVPTDSHEPSISPAPSIKSATTTLRPTVETTSRMETDIVMILTNVPSNLSTEEQIETWEDVTSAHLFQYYAEIEETFPEDWPIHILDVQTTFQDQTVQMIRPAEPMTATDNDDDPFGLPPKDGTVEEKEQAPLLVGAAPPLIEAATARKQTMTLNITYTQNVTYGTYVSIDNITDSDVYDRLFVIPFQTDSFTYTISLINAMNWSTFIFVDYVFPGHQESPVPAPTLAPTENENNTGGLGWASTIAISGAIILAACLIVAFLLWERVHKGDPNAMMFADRRGDASTTSSIGGMHHHNERLESTGGIQGDLATMSEHDIGGLPMEMYSINRHNKNFNKNSIITGGGENNNYNTNNSDGEEITNSSIRSAPLMSTIRRSEVQQRIGGRGVLTPNTNTSTNSGFISRTNNTHTSGITNSSSSSSKTMGERSVENDGSDPYRSSPGIPQQIPISSRNDSNHTGGGRSSSGSYNSVNNHNNNRLPPLPPLPPPPRSFEPPHQFDHVDVVGSAAHFRRPSARRSPFGMRVSSITDSSITDFSYLSEAFRMDREYSDDLGALNDTPEFPPISDHVYVFYYYF